MAAFVGGSQVSKLPSSSGLASLMARARSCKLACTSLRGSVCGLPQRNVVYSVFQLRTVLQRAIDLAPKTGVSVLQVAFSHHCVLTSLVARWRSNMTIAQGTTQPRWERSSQGKDPNRHRFPPFPLFACHGVVKGADMHYVLSIEFRPDVLGLAARFASD
jgi:hypothetical protein